MAIKETFARLLQAVREEPPQNPRPAGSPPLDPQLARINEQRRKLLARIPRGVLVIPANMRCIPDRMFDGFVHGSAVNRIEVLIVPGSVKRIGLHAFANCRNLRRVVLFNGVESIDAFAFTGCDLLRSIRLPASVKDINGGAFFNSGIAQPVFSADGRRLIYYPPKLKAAEYCVPEGVEEIRTGAFDDAKQLEKVVLPRSLKRIARGAFFKCSFHEIAIPAGVTVEDGAFYYRDHPLRIICAEDRNALEERTEYCRMMGRYFLTPASTEAPQDAYWKEDGFRALARECATGSVDAMDRMGDFFLARAQGKDPESFEQRAAQFWRVRAWRYGSEAAGKWLLEWCEANPNANMPSPRINECLFSGGDADGRLLNALGFPFFDADKSYHLSGVDAQGVVQISSYVGYDGADESGYGSENYYDWWFLDEYLNLPEGAGCIRNCSDHDANTSNRRFRILYDQVAAMCRRGT